jgi:hypothetical protein
MYPRKNVRLLFRANEISLEDFASQSADALLSAPIKTRRQSPKQREFVCGPIPIDWLVAAAAISAAAAYLGVLLWHLAHMRQEPVVLSHTTLQRYGLQPRQGLRLLRALAERCLIHLEVAPG